MHEARRTALELLLSDHLGDCVAPCQFGCPAKMDIPTMLRQIAAGKFREAIATVKRDIALPAMLGRICPAPCEKVCRRGDHDGAVSICLLKRLVADVDLASDDPYLPACKPSTGKRVAIVGAGPTGLSAAYYLRAVGPRLHAFRRKPVARRPIAPRDRPKARLPRTCSKRKSRPSRGWESTWRWRNAIGPEPAFSDLRARFDAVLLACGATARQQAEGWGLPVAQRGMAGQATDAMRLPCRPCLPPARPFAEKPLPFAALPTGRKRPRPSTSSSADCGHRPRGAV